MLSCVALRLARMCGSAMLANVVSSTCSSTAMISPMVTISRCPVGSGCVATSGALAISLLLVVETDRGGHRKTGDHRLRRRTVEGYPHRHTLRHLDPVPVGVLRREQRELTAGAHADALYVAFEFHSGVGVDLHRCALARDHPPDVLLLEVRLNPRRLAVDEREHAEPGHRHLADLQVVRILDHAVHRRTDFSSRQIE